MPVGHPTARDRVEGCKQEKVPLTRYLLGRLFPTPVYLCWGPEITLRYTMGAEKGTGPNRRTCALSAGLHQWSCCVSVGVDTGPRDRICGIDTKAIRLQFPTSRPFCRQRGGIGAEVSAVTSGCVRPARKVVSSIAISGQEILFICDYSLWIGVL